MPIYVKATAVMSSVLSRAHEYVACPLQSSCQCLTFILMSSTVFTKTVLCWLRPDLYVMLCSTVLYSTVRCTL